jgi:hypothetical protein
MPRAEKRGVIEPGEFSDDLKTTAKPGRLPHISPRFEIPWREFQVCHALMIEI